MKTILKTKPLTVGDVAEMCHVTERCVLVWINDGKLKTYKTPGGHNRVKKDDFEEFIFKYNMPVAGAGNGFVGEKKILIVEDDKNMVQALKRMLKRIKIYDVDFAYDGFEAGHKLVTFLPDLVILDIKMPGIDGYEVIKRIKLIPQDKNIKIIVVSAYLDDDGKKKALNTGADMCMDKPFDNEVLLKNIETLLKKK